MKAFLSDRGLRRKAGPEYICDPTSSRDPNAEDPLGEPNLAKLELAREEAERILAETQPYSVTWESAEGPRRRGRADVVQVSARAAGHLPSGKALRLALERFVL